MLADYTKDELIAAWGEPTALKTDAEETLRWENEKGTVILRFENDQITSAEAVSFHHNDAPWPFSLAYKNGSFSILAALLYIILPLLLFFALISLVLKKLGWLGNEEKKDHGKEIFAAKETGSKPWSGV